VALGAPASAILRQSVLGGLMLGVAGGALAWGCHRCRFGTALHLLPDSLPRVDSNQRWIRWVMNFSLLAGAGKGALCSVAPAFAATPHQRIEKSQEGAEKRDRRGDTRGCDRSWLCPEIAIALVLLTRRGCFCAAIAGCWRSESGFSVRRTSGGQLPAAARQYSTPDFSDNFDRPVIDRLTGKPGS